MAARALYLRAQAMDARAMGIEYQLAVICFSERDSEGVVRHAQTSIDRGEQVPEAMGLIGVSLAQRSDFRGAISWFARAQQANPTDAQTVYNWSEVLRKSGDPAGAEAKLREALALKPNEVLYAFKRRMALIDAGRGAELQDRLRAELAAKPPAGDWLLTSAAAKVKAGEFAGAAAELGRARAAMAPQLFATLLQDDLFMRSRAQPELAPFFDMHIEPSTRPFK